LFSDFLPFNLEEFLERRRQQQNSSSWRQL